MTYKYIIGKRLCIESRKSSSVPPKNMVTSHNSQKFKFTYRCKQGRGTLSEAFVDKVCSCTNDLERNLKNSFQDNLSNVFDLSFDSIKCEKLIGECQQNKDLKVCKKTASHQIQRKIIKSKIFAICYQDIAYEYNRPWSSA